MTTPLILDFDASLDGLEGATRLPLGEWQDRIRFGCGLASWRALERHLDTLMPAEHGTVLMGSGDFHHLSHLLLKRRRFDSPVTLVVCDNHPDNMLFPFGIHCGSWVSHAARLPQVAKIHVVGISSGDVGWRHAWENHPGPLYAGKLCYWTLGVDTAWARFAGLSGAFRSFDDKSLLLDTLTRELGRDMRPAYLSIDKDVLGEDVARTNWDQGSFTLDDLQQVIDPLAGRIVGSDITGEVSIHAYQSRWKRMLSALDEQPVIAAEVLADWQARQLQANRQILARIAAASV